jgi:hypothetical protein
VGAGRADGVYYDLGDMSDDGIACAAGQRRRRRPHDPKGKGKIDEDDQEATAALRGRNGDSGRIGP